MTEKESNLDNAEIRTPLILAVISLLFFLAISAFAGQFKVTRVYDGDTVKGKGHDVEIEVRLMGIDADERVMGAARLAEKE